MATDTLSDLLRTVRLRGAVFYHVRCGRDWAAEAPASAEFAQTVMPGVQHVMEFHMLVKGQGWAWTDGVKPVQLNAGDLILFPHGDGHRLASDRTLAPNRREANWMAETRDVPKPMVVSFHHGVLQDGRAAEADTVLVCGFLGCEKLPFNPLIAALPKMLHMPAERSGPWVARVIDQATMESANPRPGGGAVLERLSEMMFVDTVRRYLDDLPEDSRGWLSGLRDRYIGRALAEIHERPSHPWTVEEMGSVVGLSRSALHERFQQLVGLPPSQYLAQWRIQLGSRLLCDTQRPVAAIAQDVGYESEAAFSRAFKRMVGQPPAAWRREQQQVDSAPAPLLAAA